MNNDKNKTITLNAEPNIFKIHEIYNTKTGNKKIVKTCVFANKNTFGIQTKKTSLI